MEESWNLLLQRLYWLVLLSWWVVKNLPMALINAYGKKSSSNVWQAYLKGHKALQHQETTGMKLWILVIPVLTDNPFVEQKQSNLSARVIKEKLWRNPQSKPTESPSKRRPLKALLIVLLIHQRSIWNGTWARWRRVLMLSGVLVFGIFERS